MRTVLFWAAVTGWIMALIVHLLSVFDIGVEEKIPYIWGLHIGIFLIWVPTIIILKKSGAFSAFEVSGMQKAGSPIRFFKFLSERAPYWVVVIAAAGLAYAVVNFFIFFFAQTGTPAVRNGQYYLHNHGQWIRNITEQEYHHYKAATIRGFSGHWIAFYGMAAALLYPFKKNLNLSDHI